MNFIQFIISLIDRVKSDSPSFFLKLRWVIGCLAVLSIVARFLIGKDIWNPSHEDAIAEVLNYVITVAASVWGVSFTPVKDKK